MLRCGQQRGLCGELGALGEVEEDTLVPASLEAAGELPLLLPPSRALFSWAVLLDGYHLLNTSSSLC